MNKNGSLYISLIALVASAAAVFISVQNSSKAVDVETVLKNNPKLVIDAMQNYEQIAREEALAQAQKVLEDNIEAINNDPNTPVIGNPEGTINLVEFFDFSCGYCHKVYPALKNIIAKNPNVKVMAKSLAFVSPVSDYAARAALAAGEQGKYAEMYTALFETQGRLTEESVNAEARRTGDCAADRRIRADGLARILHQLDRLFAHLGKVALIVLVDDLSIAHNHDLDRGRADIDSYIYIHIFCFSPINGPMRVSAHEKKAAKADRRQG